MTPREAYDKALEEGPGDKTRRIACQDPVCAYLYARYVDHCARDDTRAGACRDPYRAYRYALVVDWCARDDTRAGASRDPNWAYLYARGVDHWLHPEVIEAPAQINQTRLEEDMEFD